MWVYLNGTWVAESAAAVSIHDRGFRYGDGVFETIRVYAGRPFLCDAHLRRLLESTEYLGLGPIPSRNGFQALLGELISRNRFRDALLRVTVTRGLSEGWEPDEKAAPTVLMAGKPTAGYPASLYTDGASIVIAQTARAPSGFARAIKSLNMLPHVQAKREAIARNADEAILCTEAGAIAEGSVSNVFCVRGGRITTPPASGSLLPGITRGVVMELVRREEWPCDEALLTADDLYAADEVFLTSTGLEILPVTRVDRRPISNGRPGPVASAIRRLFGALVAAESTPLD